MQIKKIWPGQRAIDQSKASSFVLQKLENLTVVAKKQNRKKF